ncbi:MAG: YigZ family protein [Limnobacter sp.]|nr:YigZ family protein [Limnobacter sp.]
MPSTILTPAHSELIVKKSRFIGCVQPVPDRSTAKQIVESLWAQHPGAAHVCWALMAGGQSAAVDDGEPSGTAGRPMLDVLRHQDLEGVLATVVRYFGGVKLGAGGLVGAYTDCIAQALLNADKIPILKQCHLHCQAPYSLEGFIRRQIDASGAMLTSVQHGSLVDFKITLPECAAAEFVARINEFGQGRVGWVKPVGEQS